MKETKQRFASTIRHATEFLKNRPMMASVSLLLKPTQQDHSCKNRTKVVETVANENEAGLRMT